MFMVTILLKLLLLLLLLFYMLSFEFIYMHDMSKLINALCKII
jgi:hypothetical protein